MTVLGILILPVMIPLLQISVFTNPIRQEARQSLFGLFPEILVHIKDLCGLDGISKAFPCYGQIGRTSIRSCTGITIRSHKFIFRRSSRRSNKVTILFYQPVKTEIGCSFQGWIIFSQKIPILRKKEVFPDMSRQPRSTHCPTGPVGITDV